MRRHFQWMFLLGTTLLTVFVPEIARAAGGGGASMLVVVADTRRVHSQIAQYFVNSYNTSPIWFGIECLLITMVVGGTLGVLTDQIMRHIGLDLTSRELVEH
jgi:hypothetical protein